MPPSSSPAPNKSSTEMKYGLCTECIFAQSVCSVKGSEFILCNYSKIDRTFPKYPSTPVKACNGFKESPQRP